MKKHFSIWEALRFGFSTTLDNFLLFLGIFGIALGIMLGAAFITIIFITVIIKLIGQFFPTASLANLAFKSIANLSGTFGEKIAIINGNNIVQSSAQPSNILLQSFPIILIALLSALTVWAFFRLIRIFLHLGIIKIAFDFYDHNTANSRTLFSQGHNTFKGFIASMIYNFIIGVGFFLFIIPGIIWAIQFGFYQQAIVDENAGILQSLRLSSQVTRGARLELLGLYGILLLINIIGAIPMGLGLIVTIPATILALTYAYRKLHAVPITK